mgnify:CR=1 FL=1
MITKYGDEVRGLDKAIEECSEIIQILCKIKRFGIDDYHPVTRITNRDSLRAELDDLAEAMIAVREEEK